MSDDRPYPAWLIVGNVESQSAIVGVVELDQHHDGVDVELSFALLPAHWGKVIGVFSARFALCHAFECLGPTKIVAETQAANGRVLALLNRVEMRFQREVVRFGQRQTI